MLIKNGERIVFTGDSITDFDRKRPVGEGLWEGVGTGYVRLVHTLVNALSPREVIRISNTGVGGNNILDLEARWQQDVLDLNPDWVSVMIGVNDWQGGRPPKAYADSVVKFLREFRRRFPETPVALITPLWVGPKWRPKSVKFELPEYRRAAEEAVKQLADPRVKVIDGDALIDHDAEQYFTPVAVHPNDAGFAQLAERLARQL